MQPRAHVLANLRARLDRLERTIGGPESEFVGHLLGIGQYLDDELRRPDLEGRVRIVQELPCQSEAGHTEDCEALEQIALAADEEVAGLMLTPSQVALIARRRLRDDDSRAIDLVRDAARRRAALLLLQERRAREDSRHMLRHWATLLGFHLEDLEAEETLERDDQELPDLIT